MANRKKRARTSSRRPSRTAANRNRKNKTDKKRKGIIPVVQSFFTRNREAKTAFICALCFVCIIAAAGFAFRKNAVEVRVGDSYVGTLQGKNITSADVISSITELLEVEVGASVQILDAVTTEAVHASKEDLVSMDKLYMNVKKNLNYQIEAAVINVNGEDEAIVNNSVTANEILNEVKNSYLENDSNKNEGSFVEEVAISNRYLEPSSVMTRDEALNALKSEKNQVIPYTIVKDDSLSKLSSVTGLKQQEILDANPGMTRETVFIVGDVINLIEKKPVLTVQTKEQITYTETIPVPETQYEQDAALSSGTRVIRQQGAEGEMQYTAEIIKVNGVEQSRNVLSETIVKEAVPEIVAVGP